MTREINSTNDQEELLIEEAKKKLKTKLEDLSGFVNVQILRGEKPHLIVLTTFGTSMESIPEHFGGFEVKTEKVPTEVYLEYQ